VSEVTHFRPAQQPQDFELSKDRASIMATTATESALDSLQSLHDELDAINAQVTKQGAVVKQLKKDAASSQDIADAVTKLQELKICSTALQQKLTDSSAAAKSFPRAVFDDVMLRKMFIVPAFEIHGGVKGLYDLGPPACALKVGFACVES
jgi:WHEP-TRS domain